MSIATQDATRLSDSDQSLIQRLKELEGEISEITVRVKGQSITLPRSIGGLALQALFEKTGVQDEREVELTTTEAADLLNVSRPHLVKLLKQGKIPHHKVGSHHRVYRRDVLSYKEGQRKTAEDALQALTDQAQELGMGYGS